MTSIVETKNLADLYGLPPVDWAATTAPLDRGVTQAPETGGPDRHPTWLTTINADGSPHVTGVGALWVDGTFWFVTGERTRKGRNVGIAIVLTFLLGNAGRLMKGEVRALWI